MPVKDSCSIEIEVTQPRKNVRLLQKREKILPRDTLMSTDVDGTATDQLMPIKSELEVQEEEEDEVQTITDDKETVDACRNRTDGAVSELNSALSDLNLKDTSQTIERPNADNSQTADTRKLTCGTMPSQQLPGDASSNVTDRPPTIVCSSSSYHSSPQGSPRIRRALSKESDTSFGNQDDNQHLNEYEVLAEIGKVSLNLLP